MDTRSTLKKDYGNLIPTDILLFNIGKTITNTPENSARDFQNYCNNQLINDQRSTINDQRSTINDQRSTITE